MHSLTDLNNYAINGKFTYADERAYDVKFSKVVPINGVTTMYEDDARIFVGTDIISVANAPDNDISYQIVVNTASHENYTLVWDYIPPTLTYYHSGSTYIFGNIHTAGEWDLIKNPRISTDYALTLTHTSRITYESGNIVTWTGNITIIDSPEMTEPLAINYTPPYDGYSGPLVSTPVPLTGTPEVVDVYGKLYGLTISGPRRNTVLGDTNISNSISADWPVRIRTTSTQGNVIINPPAGFVDGNGDVIYGGTGVEQVYVIGTKDEINNHLANLEAGYIAYPRLDIYSRNEKNYWRNVYIEYMLVDLNSGAITRTFQRFNEVGITANNGLLVDTVTDQSHQTYTKNTAFTISNLPDYTAFNPLTDGGAYRSFITLAANPVQANASVPVTSNLFCWFANGVNGCDAWHGSSTQPTVGVEYGANTANAAISSLQTAADAMLITPASNYTGPIVVELDYTKLSTDYVGQGDETFSGSQRLLRCSTEEPAAYTAWSAPREFTTQTISKLFPDNVPQIADTESVTYTVTIDSPAGDFGTNANAWTSSLTLSGTKATVNAQLANVYIFPHNTITAGEYWFNIQYTKAGTRMLRKVVELTGLQRTAPIIQANTYTITSSQTFTPTATQRRYLVADILAVGGGGGGSWSAGGGGANVVEFANVATTDASYAITIGAGGAYTNPGVNAYGTNGGLTMFNANIGAQAGYGASVIRKGGNSINFQGGIGISEYPTEIGGGGASIVEPGGDAKIVANVATGGNGADGKISAVTGLYYGAGGYGVNSVQVALGDAGLGAGNAGSGGNAREAGHAGLVVIKYRESD